MGRLSSLVNRGRFQWSELDADILTDATSGLSTWRFSPLPILGIDLHLHTGRLTRPHLSVHARDIHSRGWTGVSSGGARSGSAVFDFSVTYGANSQFVTNCFVLNSDFGRLSEPALDLEVVFRDLIRIWGPEVAVLCSDEFFSSHGVGLENAPTDWLAYSTRPLTSQSGLDGTNFHHGTITSVSS